MRFRMLLGAACVLVAVPAAAQQRAHQVEIGVLGQYVRFDRLFALENQFGGGGRFGWFVTDRLSFEIDGAYLEPQFTAGKGALVEGAASLVMNFGGERNLFYVLAGYTRLAFTRTSPYDFNDNNVHAALGDRVFLEPGVALRGEVRAIYTPSTRFGTGGAWAGHVVGSLGISFFLGGRPLTDTDHDGLPDRRDACPGTPPSATIDTRGCPQDSDRDAVYNGLDACPNTPVGAQTDASGCPLDEDNDAVPDGLDQCRGTPAGAAVDAHGCPADADGDRVPDGLDQCPNTPAGVEVDSSGCATAPRDADGDGVDTAQDRCPGTTPGTRVDASGCPVLFTPERVAVVLRGVTFETGRSTLRPESFAVLDQVAASLLANPDIRIEIGGHTDNSGGAAINLRLSQERANTVFQYLAGRGVQRSNMTVRGYGSTQPVAPNTTAAGRAQNRRVELRRIN